MKVKRRSKRTLFALGVQKLHLEIDIPLKLYRRFNTSAEYTSVGACITFTLFEFSHDYQIGVGQFFADSSRVATRLLTGTACTPRIMTQGSQLLFHTLRLFLLSSKNLGEHARSYPCCHAKDTV